MLINPRTRGRSRSITASAGAILRAASQVLRSRSASLSGLGGAAAAAGAAYAAYPRKKQRTQSRNKGSGIYMDDGNHPGKKVQPKRRRKRAYKKKTLTSRVKALEGKTPKLSTIWRTEHQFYKLQVNAINEKRYFCIPIQEWAVTFAAAAQFAVNGQNTRAMIKNYKGVFFMKNSRTSNCKIRYMILKCKGDTAENALYDMREFMIDRGLTFANTVQAAVSPTATASAIPIRLALPAGEQFRTMFPACYDLNEWKPTGKLSEIVLAPGDTCEIIFNSGKSEINYDDVQNANPTTVYYKNQDAFLVLEIHGQPAHDETNVDNIGISPVALDCSLFHQVSIAVQDGKSARYIEHVDNDTNEGLTTLVHVDNHASAVEIADQ